MADKKVSALTSGAPATGADELHVARGSADYKLTLAQVAAIVFRYIEGLTSATAATTDKVPVQRVGSPDGDPKYVTAQSIANLAVGKQTIWVPAGAMTARTTQGPASGTAEMTTNKNMVKTLDFDGGTGSPTALEYAQFDIRMPKSWNEGTVSFIPVWSHSMLGSPTPAAYGVVWKLDAVAISDGDSLDAAFGTAQESADTGGSTGNVLRQGPESAAITIAGSPAAEDLVMFRVWRDSDHASDTLQEDARLHGVVLLYTTDAINDA